MVVDECHWLEQLLKLKRFVMCQGIRREEVTFARVRGCSMREEEEEEEGQEEREEEDQIACEGPHNLRHKFVGPYIAIETLLLIFCYDFRICDNFVCPDESE